MRQMRFIWVFAVLVLLSACRPPEASVPKVDDEEESGPVSGLQSPLIQRDRSYDKLLKRQLEAVEATKSRLKTVSRAGRGRNLADECLRSVGAEEKRRYEGKPYLENVVQYAAPCAYYRMIFTGLYYKAKVVGYQKGLQSMIRDALIVIKSDPGFEEGGAYRVLGYIYLRSPSFSLKKEPVLRDLKKAYDYAVSSLSVAPDNPENQMLMGEILWEKKDYEGARICFEKSLAALPRKGFQARRERELVREVKGYLARYARLQ